MLELIGLIPSLPLAGFVVLALSGARLSRGAAAGIGVGSVGASAVLAFLVAGSFMLSPPKGHFFNQTLWTWIDSGAFRATIGFRLDALSVIMMLVVTGVGFLIHFYSSEFMEQDDGFSRFFAYMNLFVGSMLTLVLADNLLLLYLGWEAVGLCSYLLIGFWHREPANGAAARKAFIVTRVGDTALAVGLFLLFTNLGTLDIDDLMRQAVRHWPPGSALATAAAALLLAGAVGKSAQLPLQTWLPDAMAGPTPVSALIHAATMVTAGVYLIARTHVLFELAPPVQWTVAIIGAGTLLIAGCAALTQGDIKRVLAYSTISQIGYMFLALGVGAWSAAIFHLVTHAFFKALLFLGAGAVILGLHHEHDMFKMGGLRKQLPLTFWTFLLGSASLAALPWVTAGFYSKDWILREAWISPQGSPWLWAGGLIGAFITSIYSFRMVFLTFFGEAKQQVSHKPGLRIQIPLGVLGLFSVIGGLFALPDFLQSSFPSLSQASDQANGFILEALAGGVSVAGVYVAYLLFLSHRTFADQMTRTGAGKLVHDYWFSGWGFDAFYDAALVQPYVRIAQISKNDGVELIFRSIAWINRAFYSGLREMQTGQVRWYAKAIATGAVVIVAVMLFL